MRRKFHADFELSEAVLRLTLSEADRQFDTLVVDPINPRAEDLLLACFVPLPWTADMTVTCNFPARHWERSRPSTFCNAILEAARRELSARGAANA
ncbi:hypothetical protein [Pelagovum pacificum]|uniref:Uncharacterized protein n=1 Tax=Pelagovum pacificum TaxID=2588711 RepID=A0A5C5GEJ7_9RHOB|nr:hypothetical protein [Pelagovum pacificum]QQA43941.1 hypothetical protein I8N54_05015 [Pelagovum pacificum]TNY32930.1 hypothetical protein FHY64_06535 [Pelagovum pacificum]